MNQAFRYSYFSLLPAEGWNAAVRGTEDRPYVSVVPDSGDVQLGLSVPDKPSMKLNAAQWVTHVAEKNRNRQREVFAAACGDFTGCVVEFETDSEWFRGWALHSAEYALDVTYNCPKKTRARDDDVVYRMLASLRLQIDD